MYIKYLHNVRSAAALLHTGYTYSQSADYNTSGAHLDVELSQVGLSSGLVNGELLVVPAYTQEHIYTVCMYTHIAENTYKHTCNTCTHT